jgi:glycosyltransferase involved in cell wall biosynthesis
MPDKNLLIIWAWDAENKLKNLVSNDNIIFSGPQYWDDLVYLVQNSLGLIFPWEEDFWIVPIEVMAAGKPVFAYHAGGLLETIIKWKTGEFFNEKNWDDFIENFIEFDAKNKKGYYSSKSCKKQAELFSDKNFETELLKIIKKTDA